MQMIQHAVGGIHRAIREPISADVAIYYYLLRYRENDDRDTVTRPRSGDLLPIRSRNITLPTVSGRMNTVVNSELKPGSLFCCHRFGLATQCPAWNKPG